MKTAGLSFALLVVLGIGIVLVKGPNPIGMWSSWLNAAPMAGAGPAAEREWAPSPTPAPGALEQTLLQVIPPAQPSKPLQSVQPIPETKSDLLLNSDPPSLNLNINADATTKPAVNDVPAPLIVPPVDAVSPAPPLVMAPPVVQPPEAAVPERMVDKPPPPVVQPMRVSEPNTNPMTQPGEATMKAIKIAMSAVMGAALLSSPAAAADPKDDLSKTVERLEAAIKRVEAVERGLTDFKISNSAAVSKAQTDVDLLRAKVQTLEDELKQLKLATNPATTSKRESGGDANRKMARVRLTNEYFEMMSVVVNGYSYRLYPGESRTINVTPGAFTYQVLQIQPTPQERTVDAGNEKLIRIFPQN